MFAAVFGRIHKVTGCGKKQNWIELNNVGKSSGQGKVRNMKKPMQGHIPISHGDKMIKEVKQLEYQIPFSQTEYAQALLRNHFQKADLPECLKIEKKLTLSNLRVKAWYYPEEGNKILVIMTLGQIFDDLVEEYEEKEELLLAYAVECLAMEVLKKAYDMFSGVLYEREGKYPGEYFFLDDKAMRKMPEILKEMKIKEVRCNEAFALIPQKTVVFMTEMSDQKNGGCIRLCENCSQKNCPSKRQKAARDLAALNYGYQRILGNGGNELWKKD